MNVAFTRARSKLIIVGSRTTLMGTPLLASFFDLMQERDWILKLPPDAHLLHASAPSGTPTKRGRANYDSGGPTKKIRTGAVNEGVLKGRPILKDLLSHDSY